MPTYKNIHTETHWLPGAGDVPAGETREVDRYAYLPAPADAWWELTSHEPRTKTPVLVYSGTLPSGELTGLIAYTQVQIYNTSGADLAITYNEDTASAISYPAGAVIPLDLDDEVYQIALTGAGTLALKVHGVPR